MCAHGGFAVLPWRGREETVVYVKRNVRIPGELITLRGSGVIEELVIISSSGEYRIRVESAAGVILDEEWGTLSAVSPHVSWISAYQDAETGKAVLSIDTIAFVNRLEVRAWPTGGMRELDYFVVKVRVWR